MRRVRIETLARGSAALRELVQDVRAGSVLAIPTESSYGLAVDPRNGTAVRRVFALKGREEVKPLLVVVANRGQLEDLGVAAPGETLDRFFTFWPAPLTITLPLRAPLPASSGAAALAVRVPAHPPLRDLLEATGPLTATSLNRSGAAPCDDPDEAERAFGLEVDVLVDGGRTPGGPPSTLLDATVDPPRVLRAGAFPWPTERR
ncbi:MAG TPA: L-threonylcarbamoyladenylate synthase [Thermoanaerobaculia bacterium]|nr:L-threonylcarbamoyladenylate synthase [Thermoanaerobaculia bacterium]